MTDRLVIPNRIEFVACPLTPRSIEQRKITVAVHQHMGHLAAVLAMSCALPKDVQEREHLTVFLSQVYDSSILDDAAARDLMELIAFPELNLDWDYEIGKGDILLRVFRRSGGALTH